MTTRAKYGAVAGCLMLVGACGDGGGPASDDETRVTGRLTDGSGVAIAGARVAIGTVVATTDDDGRFSVAVDAGDVVIRVDDDPAYTPSSLSVTLTAGQDHLVSLRALRRRPPQPLDIDAGGTVRAGIAAVTFAAGSLVDEGGAPATGTVQVAVTPLDVTRQANAAPGDYTATAADGSAVRLETFGMVDVDIRDAGGAPLNLADGSTASLDFALPDGSAEPGVEIALWSFDVDAARWLEDGSCTVVDEAGETRCVGDVAHFTWWNCDQILETTCVEGTVRDCDGAPISGAWLEARGIDYRGTSLSITGRDGAYCLPVKRDARVSFTAIGRSGNGIFGGRTVFDTSDEPGLCGGSSCTTVDLGVPCGDDDALSCADDPLLSCPGCLSGRVELPAAFDPALVTVRVRVESTSVRVPLANDGSYCVPLLVGLEPTVSLESPEFGSGAYDAVSVDAVEPGRCPACTEAPTIVVEPPPGWASCGSEDVSFSLTPDAIDPGFEDAFSTISSATGWAVVRPEAGIMILYFVGATSDSPLDVFGATLFRMRLSALVPEGTTNGTLDVLGSALTSYAIYDDGTAEGVVGDPNGFYFPNGEDLAWTIEADGTRVRLEGDVTFTPECAASLAEATYQLDLTVPVRTADDPVVDRCETDFGEDVTELRVGRVGRTDVSVDGTPLVVDLRSVRHVPGDDTFRFNLSGLVGGDAASLSFFVIDPVSGAQDVEGAQLDLGECDYRHTGGGADLTFDPGGPIDGTFDLTFGPLPEASPPCDTATPEVVGSFTSAVCAGG